MLEKLIGAAAVAAIVYTAVPAYAAKAPDCSGANLEKTESATEAMADGAARSTAQKEIAQAQEALLDGKIAACAMHLAKAIRAGGGNQAAYGSALNQAPGGATAAPSQWGWQPVKPAI
jgi:hypothetical protein